MLFPMAKPFTLSFSLCLLLLTTASCLASFDRLNKCQLDKLNVLEPDHRVEAEGGVIETWSSNKHHELGCGGFALDKITLYLNGLHMPSYSPYPQIMLIVQGRGAIGIAIPGCLETYEEPQEQHGGKQQPQDSHQEIHHVIEGDIVLIPPGTPYWSFNYGDEHLVAVSLLYTSSNLNQLDQNPRVFYVAGKPDIEHPESLKQGEGEEGGNVVSGFSKHLIAQSLSTDEDTAEKLQSPDDERKQIIIVKEGLSVISPTWEPKQTRERSEESKESKEKSEEREEEEEETEEGEVEEEDEPGYHRTKKWKRKETRPKHDAEHKGKGKEEEVEVEEEEEWEEKSKRGKETREEKGKKGKGDDNRITNGVEEILCGAKLHDNIGDPSHTDFYNPGAGRITNINSLTIPALRLFGLSAQYVVLYKNGIHSPHWNLNSNTVMYVTRGRGRVTVVNCQGKTVFDGELKRGHVLMVPQNFVVAQEAGSEGFEYVVFKTNDRAVTGHLKEIFRAIPAEVLSNAFRLPHSQVTQIKYNGNWGPLVNPHSTPRSPHTLASHK